MLELKELIKKIIKDNKDLVAIYRMKIYLSESIFIKIKFLRYFILVKLFIEKYILKKDIYTYKNKLKNNVPFYIESHISKRRNLGNALKTVVEKDIIFIDIFDVLFNRVISKPQFQKYIKDNENISTDLYKINPYGKLIYDVLTENNKKIYLLIDENNLDIKYIKKLLVENEITQYEDIIFYSKEIQKRSEELTEIIDKKFGAYNKFVYIGKFFQEKISNDTRNIMMIIYENCEFWGDKFRPNVNTTKMGIYCSVINNKLHEGIYKYTRSYEFGLCYGGIISYYVFTQMVLNDQKFNVELENLKQKLYNDFEDKKIIDKILDITFPKVYNNFVYDGSEVKDNIQLDDIYFNKQYDIQKGIIDFSTEYEEQLKEICGDNSIQYDEIKEIIRFLLENKKNTKKMLKEICK